MAIFSPRAFISDSLAVVTPSFFLRFCLVIMTVSVDMQTPEVAGPGIVRLRMACVEAEGGVRWGGTGERAQAGKVE